MKKTSLYSLILSALFTASCMAAPAVAEKAVATPVPDAQATAVPAAKAESAPAAKAPAAQAAVKAGPVKALSAPLPVKADGAKLAVLGDSTMHKWHADALEVSVSGEIGKDGALLDVIKAGGLSKLKLVAKAGSLKSTESKSMDKNMHEDIGAAEFPDISFDMASYEVKGDAVSAKGTLSIHGVSKDVVLEGVLSAKDDGSVNVKGSYDMKMTDYGVKPRVMAFGTIRVKDALTIAYDFDLSK